MKTVLMTGVFLAVAAIFSFFTRADQEKFKKIADECREEIEQKTGVNGSEFIYISENVTVEAKLFYGCIATKSGLANGANTQVVKEECLKEKDELCIEQVNLCENISTIFEDCCYRDYSGAVGMPGGVGFELYYCVNQQFIDTVNDDFPSSTDEPHY